MGSRFYLTGVQLGLLKVYAEQGNVKELIKIWDEIYSKQYLCEADDLCPFWLKKYEGGKQK